VCLQIQRLEGPAFGNRKGRIVNRGAENADKVSGVLLALLSRSVAAQKKYPSKEGRKGEEVVSADRFFWVDPFVAHFQLLPLNPQCRTPAFS
jgi:hypothetical protein